MLADGGLGDDELPGDRGVGVALGDEGEDLALARGQRGQRVAAAAQQLADHLGVDDGAAGGHAAQRGDEVLDVGHPVLEQVADAAAVAGVEQVGGVAVLDVLAEHDDGQPGVGRGAAPRRPAAPRR